MPSSIKPLHVNHINAVVEGFDDSVAHFREVYGAQFIKDLPGQDWHACLITIGTVIFELFVPHNFLLNARFGPHYIGLEYQVADAAAARRAVETRGIRIVRDLGVALHTHPADTFGVSVEIFDRSFHDDPPIEYLEPIKPVEYWRDEHPLGCTGLKRYSIVVSDIDAATKFLREFADATVVYEDRRPSAGARAVGMSVADTVAELLTPVEEGPIQRYLARYGDGIRATVFGVRDLQQAQSYFTARGIPIQAGDAPSTLAVAPEDNRGLRFEFSE
jgi:Glyoxalase/Bleomycin resistance protein/Dioxygenase superfamily